MKVGGYRYQAALWNLRTVGRLILLDLTARETDRMDVLMKKYKDVPMDLADASLVAIAESRSLRRVFSLDKDFFVYRLFIRRVGAGSGCITREYSGGLYLYNRLS